MTFYKYEGFITDRQNYHKAHFNALHLVFLFSFLN
jgi:hypothetical protein